MTKVTIYHNPRCSKSRQTLALLEERAVEVEVVEYLKTPPSPESLALILQALEMKPAELLRTSEAEYKDLALKTFSGTEQELISIMVQHPKLIERPIVINGDRARIGRPPEAVLDIL